MKAGLAIKEEILKNGICIAYFEIISKMYYNIRRVTEIIKNSSSNIVVAFCDTLSFIDLIYTAQYMLTNGKVWITQTTLPFASDNSFYSFLTTLNGSLLFSIHKGEIPGLKEFMFHVNPFTFPDDIFTAAVWNEAFKCLPANYTKYRHSFFVARNCTGKESLEGTLDMYFDVNTYRVTFSAYKAIYAMAYSLHNMLSYKNKLHLKSDLTSNFQAFMLMLKSAKNEDTGTALLPYCRSTNEPAGQYDIENWVIAPNHSILLTQVGSFKYSAPAGQQLTINENLIQWNHMFKKTPHSVCSESCPPGYRKAQRRLEPRCCYDCIACSEGEVANSTDMENCMKCAVDQWSNHERTKCISKSIDFLSYGDALGITLSCIAILLSFATVGVLIIFIDNRETAIVKANNRTMSYIILFCLTVSFLSSLLFIGRPLAITCLMRQASFGITFTTAISAVLAKTIIVVIAFSATKPGSKARKWVGSNIHNYIVCVCTLGEAIICFACFIHSPPFPEIETNENSQKMVLQCNEGMAFYFVVGYMGMLAFLSFIVAFLARNLPNSFNEATHITFSMLIFCSVWLSFIPAYLSTKGKNIVAVEIFTILASSAALLYMFMPKCYVIIIRPDLNNKGHLIVITVARSSMLLSCESMDILAKEKECKFHLMPPKDKGALYSNRQHLQHKCIYPL
ncbi:vomeronasal type-2 receptor 26-like [Pelobates cultripes]|nr:vomeronasal type-2 receptor 26-like [Pelobates cultripes]